MVNHARCFVYRPRAVEEVAGCLEDARARGLSLGHRGAGLSYGDLALNEGGAILDLSGLSGVVAYDPYRGTITVQAGCTFDTLWRTTIGDGWWPPVVPGTSRVTLGGAAAVDLHGKNHFRSGSFGEHVTGLTVLREDGQLQDIRSDENPAQLGSVLGALGLNCTILEVSLQLTKVHSGLLDVKVGIGRTLEQSLEMVAEGAASHEYAVAWLDCFPRRSAGRGVVHLADHIPEGHDLGGHGLTPGHQALPGRVLGVIPSAQGWRLLRPLTRDLPMRTIGMAKFAAGRLQRKSYVESHARFHFLLDHLPDWQRAYAPGGLIQYQMFVPLDAAPTVYRDMMRLQRNHGVFSYLAVLKRHRASRYSSPYAADGFSLALDFPVRRGNLPRLMRLISEFEALRSQNGGSLYAAKDAVGKGVLPPLSGTSFANNLSRRWSSS